MKQTLILMAITLTLSTANAQVNTADETSIRNLATVLEKGWNAKDGATFASVFADQHDYIVINGFYFSGMSRQQNAFAHQGLFNGIYKTNTLIMKIDKVTFFTPELAQMTVLAATYEGTTKPADPTAIMTIITQKQKDGWKIISFHNHSLAESFAAKTPPVPYQVMYASWYKN
jgi:uncharacterized protein (TIGR02246 family)